jgi:hypothetical protein
MRTQFLNVSAVHAFEGHLRIVKQTFIGDKPFTLVTFDMLSANLRNFVYGVKERSEQRGYRDHFLLRISLVSGQLVPRESNSLLCFCLLKIHYYKFILLF